MILVAELRASWPGLDAVLFPALSVIQSWQPFLLPSSWAVAVFPGVKCVADRTPKMAKRQHAFLGE